ncbi:sensor histidine kinase, partial [Pseudonocardia sp. KRD-169]|nr:sensor histidine kinase [Pseudonocardia abyssalis]
MRTWWAARGLRFRITVVVGGAALVALLALSRLGVGLLYSTLLAAADEELRADAAAVVVRLEAGEVPASLRVPTVRIVDTAGDPVDGGRALPLEQREIRTLAAGDGVVVGSFDELRRYLAV